MKYSEHVTVALGSSVIWALPLDAATDLSALSLVTMATCVTIGSIAPDIDCRKAYVNNLYLKTLTRAFFFLLLLIGAHDVSAYGAQASVKVFTAHGINLLAAFLVLGVLSAVVPVLFDHRGPIHSLAAGGIFTAAAVLAGVRGWYAFAFLWGWTAHLYGDCYTGRGVVALWPWKRKILLVMGYRHQRIAVLLNVSGSALLVLLGAVIRLEAF